MSRRASAVPLVRPVCRRNVLTGRGGNREAKGALELGPATGVGEAAAWGADEDGAIWFAVKGRYMANATVAGELKNPQSMCEPLRRLVAQALARLVP